jgi:hypothetical protein
MGGDEHIDRPSLRDVAGTDVDDIAAAADQPLTDEKAQG